MIKSTLVQVKTCCFMLPSRYLNQCWPRAVTPYVYTWGRRVQKSKWNKRQDIYAILIFWNIDFSNSIQNLVRCRRQRQTDDHYFCFVWFGVIYINYIFHSYFDYVVPQFYRKLYNLPENVLYYLSMEFVSGFIVSVHNILQGCLLVACWRVIYNNLIYVLYCCNYNVAKVHLK